MNPQRCFGLLIPTVILTLLLAASVSSGESLYSKKYDSSTSGSIIWSIKESHNQIIADDFVIQGANAIVEDADFWIVMDHPTTLPSALKLFFYESSAGGYPDSLIQQTQWKTDFTYENTGEIMMGMDVYRFSIPLTGDEQFNASADTRYWVGILAQSTGGLSSALGTIVTGEITCIWIGSRWYTTGEASPFPASDAFFALAGTLENSLDNVTWGAIKNSF
ncbi:MAG: hypothetical protein KAR40_00050 [Candidatus Sabulitectum sp.]|nr:hypothetical protein [Candidatus Sabulitectum sp.]